MEAQENEFLDLLNIYDLVVKKDETFLNKDKEVQKTTQSLSEDEDELILPKRIKKVSHESKEKHIFKIFPKEKGELGKRKFRRLRRASTAVQSSDNKDHDEQRKLESTLV